MLDRVLAAALEGEIFNLAFDIEIPKKEALIWNVTLHY